MVAQQFGNLLEYYPGSFDSLEIENNTIIIRSQSGTLLHVIVMTDSMIRFRYATTGLFEEDFSYAINRKYIPVLNKMDVKEDDKSLLITTEKVIVKISKENLKVAIYDTDMNLINEDEKGFHWEEHAEYGGNIVQMSKQVQPSEHFYGLGDKPVHMNMRGKRLQNWGSDVYGFAKNQDPLYKNIPFFMGLHNGKGYGIFFDNTFRAFFDFASERRNVTSFWADGGEMNYYFIYGPELLDVTRQYTDLTGSGDIPPMWALGYHQCKWSYYPESQVREIAQTFRDLKIPCDVIYLDIDYMDGFRCFTWDLEKFPNPKKMIQDLKDDGFKTVVIIDPGIKVDEDYEVFKDGIKNNVFCRRADGPFMRGKVWPGDCYFPDFTNPKVRKWWAGLFEELIADIGVAGVWNDMNEPALFEVESKTMPDDVRHDYDGHHCSHRKAHNVYGMQMVRATHRGVKKYRREENKRPFCITRSAYSGAQRYTSGWTGDNIASWEHLWVANVQCQRLAISGWSFVGSDIGGFTEHPQAELYVRWIQLGTFHTFMRTHSSGDHGVQEPWTFGTEATDIVRKFIELRYQLLPYLYTSFYQYVADKTPVLRPLAYIDQNDPETIYRTDEFMHGDHMLVCPILEPSAKGRYMYLPKGSWYNFWDDSKVAGGKESWVDAPLDKMPIFVRPGAIIPMYPIQQYVGEKKIETLDLHVYFGEGQTESMLYEDGGDGYEYRDGVYNRKIFTQSSTATSLNIHLTSKGHYSAEYSSYRFILHGLPFKTETIKLNGGDVSIESLEIDGEKTMITVDKEFISLELS